ncbi:dnaJ protein subfamily C member 2 [Pelomyxa schiedti]|nr:dnaJ protein subfamily C member 2 [Pelomyxa schiedti]
MTAAAASAAEMRPQSQVLMITDRDPSDNTWGDSVVVASTSGYPCKWQWNVEHAGIAFERKAFSMLGFEWPGEKNEKNTASSGETSSAVDDDDDVDGQNFKNKFKKHSNIGESTNTEDLYEVLGLGELRWRATVDQIKSAYRKLVLIYHPDKNKGMDDTMFKAITKAHETLTDSTKRRAYDSKDKIEVDDSIPSDAQASSGDFFTLFTPVFDRNSRWSITQPVPDLGNEDAPWNEIKDFYDFWYSFKTWREFTITDGYDPDEAETREEKRWMQRQNDKQMQKKKKEEHARIMKLVELAHSTDPRVKRHEEEEYKIIAAQKQARAEEIQRRRHKEAEAAAVAQKAKEEKLAAERRKVSLEAAEADKNRAALKRLAKENGLGTESATMLCAKLLSAKIAVLVNAFHANVPNAIELFNSEVKTLLEQEKAKAALENEKKTATSVAEPTKPWTEQEYSLLARAVARYPGGTKDRWQQVAAFVGTRSEQEIIEKARGMLKAKDRASSDDPYAQLKSKVKDRPIASPPTQSYERTAEPDTASSASNSPSAASVKDWTVEQQQALEQGLKLYAKEPAATKWQNISTLVKGKSPNDCYQRFAYLRDLLKAKAASSTTTAATSPSATKPTASTPAATSTSTAAATSAPTPKPASTPSPKPTSTAATTKTPASSSNASATTSAKPTPAKAPAAQTTKKRGK